ncbi:MAG: DUF2939 domain-containing protein [Gammaproteobacteria bacterium]
MMKWLVALLAASIIGLAIYAGSALVSLERLAAAARASDGATVMARTNVPRVRHAVVHQLITAYLAKIGQTRPVKPFERMAIETFGASLADDLANKLITPDNLSAILRTGTVRDLGAKIEFAEMPALANVDVSDVPNVLRRVQLIKPVEFEIWLGSDRSAGSISMHFEGTGWKLSSIALPATIVAKLIERLPAR